MMVIIAGYVLLDEDERDAYVDAHRDLVTRARAFDGCIDLAITADALDPRRVNTVELWDSAEGSRGLAHAGESASHRYRAHRRPRAPVRRPGRRAALLKISIAAALPTS
jgi:quinol monooxygenase YgiN